MLVRRGSERRPFPEGLAMWMGVPSISVADVAQAGVLTFEAPSKPPTEVLDNRAMRARIGAQEWSGMEP